MLPTGIAQLGLYRCCASRVTLAGGARWGPYAAAPAHPHRAAVVGEGTRPADAAELADASPLAVHRARDAAALEDAVRRLRAVGVLVAA